MRRLLVSMAVLALWGTGAEAQMMGGKRPKSDEPKATTDQNKKVDDKAYQEALKRIPEPKEKYDPWGVTKKPSQ